MHTKILSLVLAAASLMVTATSVYAGSPVQAIPESFDFGQVKQGEHVVTRFQLHNTGTDTVAIQWMDFSDPGLVAWTKARIAAGSSVEVSVNWNTSKLSGELEEQITLGLDDPENPEVVFKVSGTVID